MKIERKNKQLFRVEVPEYQDTKRDVIGMSKWCEQMYGEESSKRDRKFRWRIGWVIPRYVRNCDIRMIYYFYFRKESDAMYFIMSWAG